MSTWEYQYVQCLNNQQFFYYIISLNIKSNNNETLAIDYVLDILNFFFYRDMNA